MKTVEELQAFEEYIAETFNAGAIPFPVHLENGNEQQLIGVFKDIGYHDWVICSWRSHLKCLLKGVPEDEVLEAIHMGRSMALCFPEYRVLSSAIVGGSIPIAVGIAMAIKRSAYTTKVHCFMGDMTACSGIAMECAQWSVDLPIRFIVEDNDLSVCTPTSEIMPHGKPNITSFEYKSKWPHAGAGKRIQF